MRKYLAARGVVLLFMALVASGVPSRSAAAAGSTTSGNQVYLPSPTLLYPVNTVLANPNPPVFHWTGVPSAVSYTLQVATDPAFSNTIDSASLGNTRYSPVMSFGNGTYYWRLQAQGSSNQTSLYVSGSFSVNWRGAPALIQPANGAHLLWGRDNFVFMWGPQAFAATYNVEIATTTNFINPVFSGSTPLRAIQVPGDTLRNGVVYYWRVQAVDAGKHTGYWSIPASFTKDWHPTPTISYPQPYVQSSFPNVFDPVLHWSRIDGAVKYEVQISTDILLSSGNSINNTTPPPTSVADDETTPLPFLVPKLGGLVNANYYWHVRGIDDQGNPGPWSYWVPRGLGPFRLTVTPPAPVTPLTPADGQTITIPRLTWKAVPYASTYEVQQSTDQDFSKSNTKTFTTYTNELAPGLWNPVPLFNVRYYWRVRAVTGSGLVGKWSTEVTGQPWSFIFSSGGPITPIEPINNQQILVPVLRWSRLPNVDHYVVSMHDNVTNSFVQAPTQNTTYTPTDQTLLNDCATAGCYWYVSGVLADGNTEPTPDAADIGSFKSAPASAVTLYRVPVPLRPLPADPPSPEMPSFCWNATAGAVSYQVFYSTGAATFQPLADPTAATCQTPPFELPDGTYQWFVRANAQTGGILADGPISQFSVDAALLSTGSTSGCGLLSSDYLSPLPKKINVHQPEISWNSVPCAHSYHIYVATDPFFTNLVDEQVNYSYTVYLPKVPYYPTNATVYVLIRPIAGAQKDGTPVELPPGASGLFNGVRLSLTAPLVTLLSPLGNARLDGTPLFTWSRFDQASAYEIQVGTTPDLAGTPVIDANTFSATYAPTTDLADGAYYWRVRPTNAAGQKLPWSVIRAFTKRSAAPVLLAPAQNTKLTRMPIFTWKPLQRAAQYEIQVSANDPSFLSAPLDTAKVNVPAYVPKGVYPAIARFSYFYWRVRAIDAGGNTGPWSTAYRFTISFPYPLLIAPGPNAVLTTKYPVLGWRLMPDAASYVLEISSVQDFSSISQSVPTVGTAWTPKTPFAPGTYYWRVRAVDGAGNVGLPSVSRIFIEPQVSITAAYLVSSTGARTTSFPHKSQAVYIYLAWKYADPTKDTFQLILYANTGTQITQSTVAPFTATTGNDIYVYYSTVNGKTVALNSGAYRLDLLVDGKVDTSLKFTVK